MAIFRTFKANEKWYEKSDSSRNRGIKLQFSNEEGKRLLVRIIGRFEKSGFHCTNKYSNDQGQRKIKEKNR